MNRRAGTLLPVTSTLLQPCITPQQTQQSKLVKNRQNQEKYYNRVAKDLPKLKKGNVVRIKPTRLGQPAEWRKGIVTSCHGDRSYLVETEDGRKYRRNRIHLRKSQESPFNTDDELPYDTASFHEYNDEADHPEPKPADTHASDAKALPPQRSSEYNGRENHLATWRTMALHN